MTTTPATTRRRQGRPRDPGADDAIIGAVFDVIAESGFAGFSVEAVAARAGVGKATIYRRWSSRDDLLIAAARHAMADNACPDTGNLREDLVTWVWEKYRRSADAPGPRLVGQVVAEARSNPDLRGLLRRFHEHRRKAFVEMVGRAVERGEVDASLDGMLLLDLVSGALLHRSLFSDRQVRRIDVENVVDAALLGVGAGVPAAD